MAKSLFAECICRLMLVFVVLVLCRNEVHSHVNPGLQLRLSQSGFDYAGDVAADRLYDAMQAVKISDSNETTSMLFGTAKTSWEDMNVTGVTKLSSNVRVRPGRIIWTLTNVGISIMGRWKGNYNWLTLTISDSGNFTCLVRGATLTLSVSLGLASTGRATISGIDCSLSISSMSLKFSGGTSWLYNMFNSYLAGPEQILLEQMICQGATNGLHEKTLLTSFPLQQIIATDYLFDYSLLSAPQIQNGFMDTKHKAAFYYNTDKPDALIEASPFSTATSSNQMLTIWVSDYVPNTIGSALYRQNILRYTLTKRNIQDSYKSFLDTTCPRSNCIGTIFPILSTQYPSASVEMEMTATRAPTTTISSAEIQVTFSGNISIRARLPSGSLVNCFTASVILNVFGTVNLNGTKLMGSVTRVDPIVSNVRNYVGRASESSFSTAISRVESLFFIPKMNERGQQGIQIPVLDFVKFKDVSLKMEDRCLLITANVE